MKRRIRTWQEVMESGGLATVPEVAQALMLSEPTVYNLCKQGKLSSVKVGKLATRFRPRDDQALMDDGRQGGE